MLILTNCLSKTADEGCLKVADSLIKRIKKAQPESVVISYERTSDISDEYLSFNKFLFNFKLFRLIKKNKQPFLYVPFPSRVFSMALRVFVLSFFANLKVNVLVSMKGNIDFKTKVLLKLSRAKYYVFSKDTYELYVNAVGRKNVNYFKTGIDTDRFVPADDNKANELRIKYGISTDKPVILHAGHMKKGRNIAELLKINPDYQVLLLTSTLTKNEEDSELKNQLSERKNIKIIDEFIPNVEEIFQLSDVYYFPVVEEGNCIDIPLSCLEAAACNKPIVTTDYGGMKDFKGKNGFCFIDSFEDKKINYLINEALKLKNVDTRSSVMDYDWNKAADYLINNI